MDLALDGQIGVGELNSLLNDTPGIVGTGLFTGLDLEVLS